MRTIDIYPMTFVCARCGSDNIMRVKCKNGNGAWRVQDYCKDCERNAIRPGFWIPLLRAGDVDDLPILRDDTIDMPPCERCGGHKGVELHHWAPQHIFNDAENWPTSWLCKECHDEWHDTMGEHPYICKPCLQRYNHVEIRTC